MNPEKKKNLMDLQGEPATVTIKRASELLGLHPHTIRQAIKAGQLTARQIGKRNYLLRDELINLFTK